jgi:hypothetical protein
MVEDGFCENGYETSGDLCRSDGYLRRTGNALTRTLTVDRCKGHRFRWISVKRPPSSVTSRWMRQLLTDEVANRHPKSDMRKS